MQFTIEATNVLKQNLVQNALGLYNWQATKMTVKERLTFLFNNNILSDVTFVVGRDVHQQRIPAHRFVLSVGSAVFDAMFNRHSSKVGTSAIGEFTILNYPTLYPTLYCVNPSANYF